MIAEAQFNQMETFLKSCKMTMNSYLSENTGFTYYYSHPSYEATANNAPPQILYAALFVATLIGGLILIFMLSARNIRPIIQLGQKLQVTEQEKSHLQKVMDSQRPIIFHSYVRQFLRGMILSPQEASYAKTFLGLTEENLLYNGLYIVAYNSANEYHTYPEGFLTHEDVIKLYWKHLKNF